jgi:hypothetical protein
MNQGIITSPFISLVQIDERSKASSLEVKSSVIMEPSVVVDGFESDQGSVTSLEALVTQIRY